MTAFQKKNDVSELVGGSIRSGGEVLFPSLVQPRKRVARRSQIRALLRDRKRPGLSALLLIVRDQRHMHKDFSHEVVDHSAREYIRGEARTNTVEGYFSILKRGS